MSEMASYFVPRGGMTEIETGAQLAPDFGADGLLPVVTTDVETGEVLMLAYMNAEAFAQTFETGTAHYYSRSRQELWKKGETSGQIQQVREIRIDCDQDAIWLKVAQLGRGACHVGYKSCFYRRVVADDHGGVRLETTQEPVSDTGAHP